jgi:hypothetical protein
MPFERRNYGTSVTARIFDSLHTICEEEMGDSLKYAPRTDWKGYPDEYGCTITMAGLALDLKGIKPDDGFAIRNLTLTISADGEGVSMPLVATTLPDHEVRTSDGFDMLVLDTLTTAVERRRRYLLHPPTEAEAVATYEEAQRMNTDFDNMAAAIVLGTYSDEGLSYDEVLSRQL